MKYYTDKGRDGQDKLEKTCRKTQHVKIDMERDVSIIICRMAAVGENYNSTRDIYIYDSKMTKVLTSHDVTWGRRDSFCKDQYVTEQPEESPTAPVRIRIQQLNPPPYDSGFSKFNFEEGLWDE